MKRIAFLFSFFALQLTAFSQLGVGTNSPDASAQLDVTATDKGFLAPRIALTGATDVATIASPATGLMIYNTATAGIAPNNVLPGYYYFDGVKWIRFINSQPSATISFSTSDPNSGSPTFTPNTPQSTDFIYVSAVNSSLWVWNGTAYVSYSSVSNTPFFLANTTTDAGGNKTSAIYRSGSIGVGTSNPSRLIDVVNTTSTYAGLIEAEGAVNNSYSRGMAIRMRRGTSASPSAIQLNDVSAYGFAGYDGTSFSTTSAGMAGIATENWTSTAKGMGLVFSTTNNATSTLSERMRINHNGFVGIGTINPVSLLSNTNSNINASNNMGISTQSLTWLHSGPGFVQAVYNPDIIGHGLNVKVRGNSSTTTAFEVGQAATATTSSNPLFKVQGDGNIGVRTTTPLANLHINSELQATATVNTNGQMLRLMRPQNPGVKWENIAQFNLGSYSTNLNSNSRLDLVMNDGGSVSTSNIMTWLANGNVGIGTVTPNGGLSLYGPSSLALPVNIQGSGGPTKELVFGRGGLTAGFAAITGVDNGSFGGGLSFIVKPSGSDNFPTNAIQAMVLDWNGNMGLGTGSPTQSLDVNGRVRIRTIDTGVASDSILVVNGGVIKKVTKSAGVNIQTANYTLTASDNGNIVIMNSATAVTLTVPATLPAGFVVQIIQKGAGQVSVVGSGATINSANGFKTRVTNSAIGVVMETSTLGYVTGDSNF